VLLKAQVTDLGNNSHFVLTSRADDADKLYQLYAQRGELKTTSKNSNATCRRLWRHFAASYPLQYRWPRASLSPADASFSPSN